MNHIEERMQEWCVRWFDYQYPQYRLLLHHSPNGGRRDVREAARFKRMGVRAGFPDLILLLPNEEYNYLAIELKTDNGKQSDGQKKMAVIMEGNGGKYIVVRCFEEFADVVNKWMNNFLTEYK